MKIALDYDETFTADPELWTQFVRGAQSRGHDVAFVTFRSAGPGNSDIAQDASSLGMAIVFCGGRQKSNCYQADVWIDDSPELIPSLHQMSVVADLQRGK